MHGRGQSDQPGSLDSRQRMCGDERHCCTRLHSRRLCTHGRTRTHTTLSHATFQDEYSEFPALTPHHKLQEHANAPVLVRNFDDISDALPQRVYGFQVCRQRTALLGASGSALATTDLPAVPEKWG
jgi:hypothetical protein